MTEAQAWREIARAFAEDEPPLGLCAEFSNLHDVARIDADTYWNMRTRVRAHAGCTYAYPTRFWSQKSSDGPRVLAALWLALDAENDTPAPLV